MTAEPANYQRRQLIERMKRRDPQALMQLYDRYGKLLYSIILRAVNDAAMAEDLTQETFLRVWNRIGTFDEEKGELEGWLVTIARHQAFDYLRSRRGSRELSGVGLHELEQLGLFRTGESVAESLANTRAVRDALQTLNDDQRAVIALTHFEGMTQAEIAAKLNKPLGTVKGLVRSALKSLRAAMAGASLP